MITLDLAATMMCHLDDDEEGSQKYLKRLQKYMCDIRWKIVICIWHIWDGRRGLFNSPYPAATSSSSWACVDPPPIEELYSFLKINSTDTLGTSNY